MKYLYFKDKELKVKSKIQDNELDDYYDQMLIMNGDYNTQTPDHKDTVYYESGDEELREAVEEVIGVEAKEEIAWTDKPTEENTKDEIKAWMDSNDCEYNSGDTKQDLLDKIPELKQEAVEAVDAVEAIEAISIGDVKEEAKWVVKQDEDGNDMKVKSMKYSILYMKAVKALQEAMERIEGLESKVEALEA